MRDELKTLIDAGSVVVVDTLPSAYYEKQHLPGALNIVESEVHDVAAELLPDKDAAIVTYCTNTACANSQAVATRLERLGYTNVRKYRDGIEDWVAAGLPTESAVARA
jgi:rhodanese-related sulfurtransferase